MRAAKPTTRRNTGFTLVEAVMTMAVVVILLASAAPSFSAMLEKQRLDGATSRLSSDIHFARAEAALRGETVRLSLHGSVGGCYLIHTGAVAACSCSDSGASVCTGSALALKAVGFGIDGATRLGVSGLSTSIAFAPLHGTTSPTATLTLTAASGRSIREIINLMGNVRICSPAIAAPAVPGYAVC